MRPIDADYVLSALGTFHKTGDNDHYMYGIRTAREIVENAPTIGDESVKPIRTDGYIRDAHCGSCKAWLSDHSWAYCPRCGKKVKWDG